MDPDAIARFDPARRRESTREDSMSGLEALFLAVLAFLAGWNMRADHERIIQARIDEAVADAVAQAELDAIPDY